MPSATAPTFSPGFLRTTLAVGLAIAAASATAAELPACVATALAHFAPEVPPGWSYTVEVAKGTETSTERFDAGQGTAGKWTLVAHNGQVPTFSESTRYTAYREATGTTSAAKATFAPGDLDYASAAIVRQAEDRLWVRFGFRADAADPILAHIDVEFEITRAPARVVASTLRLLQPWSPVLGMKMISLEVQTTYAAPEGARPALPAEIHSIFHGRMFWFWSMEEDVTSRYSDLHPASPAPLAAPL